MSAAEPGLPPEGMVLTGVDLGGDYERGTATVHGLSLLFTVDGITVQGPEPGAERLVAWSGLTSASCRARARQGDGTTAMVLILQSRSQTVRFFLPSDHVTPGQAAYLDQALPIWLARYGGGAPAAAPGPTAPPGPPSPPPSPPGPASAPAAPPPAPTPPAPSPVATPPGTPGPAEPPAPPMQPVDPGAPPSGPRRFLGRPALFVAVGTLVAAIIAVSVYFATDDSGHAAISPPPTSTTAAPPAADHQLVESVNLRLSDLPAGWKRVPPISTHLTPAQKKGEAQAVDAFAGCLGMSRAFIGGLFGDRPQPDQTAAGDSPTFASGDLPTVIAQSHTTVVKSSADALADAAPFTKPNFASCFSQFQNASLAAQVPGGSATTTPVTLLAPPGVGVYGYLTTSTLPGQGTVMTQIVFMIGGRTETGLTLQTVARSVPNDALDAGYTAMVRRIAGSGRA